MCQFENALKAVLRDMESSARNWGREPGEISLLAVSKRVKIETIHEFYDLGLRRFGENYVQEAAEKQKALAGLPGVSWTLIGNLQKNKAKLAANLFDRIETVDSFELAQKLAKCRDVFLPPLEILVQINVSAEPQKSGVAPETAVALAARVASLERLRFKGFMAIAEATEDPAEQKRQFAIAKRCFDEARAQGLSADTLSMGMSHDMDAAIASGATEVRIGTALFGKRIYN